MEESQDLKVRAVLTVLLSCALAGCGGRHALIIGSKNFTEQLVLGEIVAQQLEARLGRRVDRKLNLGGTLLAHEALRTGSIDLYPEYTGTALTEVLKLAPERDASIVLERVRSEYRRRWNLEWLGPLGFNNSFAMVIRGADARSGRVASLSDAAARRTPWVLGVGYEFLKRPDGLGGLLRTYHLPLRGTPVSMDLGLLYQALQHGQVDMVAANATDGLLSALDAVPLRDDRKYFPPYQAAVVARSQALAQPGVREALTALEHKLSDEIMRKLNYEVDGKHRRPADVARDFLHSLK